MLPCHSKEPDIAPVQEKWRLDKSSSLFPISKLSHALSPDGASNVALHGVRPLFAIRIRSDSYIYYS